MAEFQNTIDLLGDEVVAASIIDRTITEFKDDSITQIGSNAFYECTALKSVDLPNATKIGEYAFRNCTALTSANVPNVTDIGASAFYKCTALTIVDTRATYIARNAFYWCNSLTTLILRSPTVCVIAHRDVLSNTETFGSGGKGGKVYVPRDLIEAYKTTSWWDDIYSYGTCNFVAIEGSEYE